MASEEEWRQIGYQRSLGEQGYQTGNIHNAAGYDTYLRNKASEAPGWSEQPMTGYQPTSHAGGSRRPMSLGGSIIMGSLILGGLVFLVTGDWTAGIGTAVGMAVMLGLLAAFFRTAIGQVVGMIVGALFWVAAYLGATYLVWENYGIEPAGWMLIAGAAFLGIAAVRMIFPVWFDRVFRWTVRLTVLVAVVGGGIWIALEAGWF